MPTIQLIRGAALIRSVLDDCIVRPTEAGVPHSEQPYRLYHNSSRVGSTSGHDAQVAPLHSTARERYSELLR